MLGIDPTYYALIRKYTVLFGNLFTDLKVPRYTTDGATTRELVKVPIAFASREKTLARVLAEPGAEPRAEAVVLPRLSFDMGAPAYDPTRHQSSAEQIRVYDSVAKTYSRLYSPVPYDFPFNLYVYSRTYEDGLKIVEQVLPFFTPDFTVRAELIPGVATMNVPVVIGPMSINDNSTQGQLADRRMIVWTIPFTVKGWLFGPEHPGGVIKFIDLPFRTPPDDGSVPIASAYANNTSVAEEVTIQPGLLANGSPTTNAAASVAYDTINFDDDWAFAVTIVSIDQQG